MAIDASQVQWDESPQGGSIDASQVKWDEPVKEKGYIEGRIEAVKSAFDPATYKQAASDISNFPPIPRRGDGSADLESPIVKNLQEKAGDIGVAFGPTTAMSKAARTAITGASEVAADTVKQATLESAGKVGYSVPRSNIKQSFLTNLGERFGGKQAIEATAQMKNQPVTNKLVAKALGVADDTPITTELLQGIRDEAGKAYEAVKQVGVLSSDDAYRNALGEIRNKYSGASKDFPELANQEVGKLVRALSKKEISAEGAIEQIKNLRSEAAGNLSFN